MTRVSPKANEALERRRMDKIKFMEGVIKQEAYEEFFKVFKDAQAFGTGYLKMEFKSEGIMELKHIPPEDISIKLPLVLQCPECLLGGEWKVNGRCIRCGHIPNR